MEFVRLRTGAVVEADGDENDSMGNDKVGLSEVQKRNNRADCGR